jgi:hypothetical protein
LAHMSTSTYFRPNIHQNGPEILGVNTCVPMKSVKQFGMEGVYHNLFISHFLVKPRV